MAKKTRDGRWYLVDPFGEAARVLPLDWQPDAEGHWPRVDFAVRDLGEKITCPHCGSSWTFQMLDCVFGRARRDGNDVIVLVRCSGCRLPHRVRALGFITAYPRVVALMGGWARWEERVALFSAEEDRLYGPEAGKGGG